MSCSLFFTVWFWRSIKGDQNLTVTAFCLLTKAVDECAISYKCEVLVGRPHNLGLYKFFCTLGPFMTCHLFLTSSFYYNVAGTGKMRNQNSKLIIFLLTSSNSSQGRCLVQEHLWLKLITEALEPSVPHPPLCKTGIFQQTFACTHVSSLQPSP